MLLTESYREQNKLLHSDGNYGLKGHLYAPKVVALAQTIGTDDILDYGCGQHTLQRALDFPIKEYDPCIEGFDSPPKPAAIVVCTDVLEHIEPDCLDDVLDDLARLTLVAGLFAVDTRPAQKILPDGRNAHLIQKPADWWFPKIYSRFCMVQMTDILFSSNTTPGLVKSLGFIATVGGSRKG